MAEILKGAPVAAAISEDLIVRVEKLKTKGIIPLLAILRVGERPDDLSYERSIIKRCEKTGIALRQVILPEDADRSAILGEIEQLNTDPSVHGVLMFRPLADKAVETEATLLLDPKKDVDAMTPTSMAGVFTGSGAGFAPCTAEACIALLKYYQVPLSGINAVVIGRSPVIGKPAAMLLQQENATVTMCHTKTKDLAQKCAAAELLIAAAGRAEMVDETYLNDGQVVIDVGINVNAAGKLCGDVAFEAAEKKAAAITPVPGGVGAVTTSILASHVVRAAEQCIMQNAELCGGRLCKLQ